MAILVTGGAGYIGSVAVEELRLAGERPVVVDNLVYGHRKAVDSDVPFYEGDIGDRGLIRKILRDHDIEAVMHFAAFAYVGESVAKPFKYYENNLVQTLALLDELVTGDVDKIVFSSSCATYGEPVYTPIDEDHPQIPTSPYGRSKLVIEQILGDLDKVYGFRSVALRYFNAAGATERHGEHHEPETHLIPLVLDAAAGERSHVSVFGTDYDTEDGTAVRDYIHISDLSRAHSLAMEYLRNGGDSDQFNLGNGTGHSVREVIEAAEMITGRGVRVHETDRRPGDASVLVAKAEKAGKVLGWEPEFTEIGEIIASAWRWRETNPDGYGSGKTGGATSA